MPNRRTATAVAFALSASLTACLDQQPSLYPLFSPAQTVALTGIEGDWVEAEGDIRLRFERDGDEYVLRVPGDDGLDMVLAARFGRVAERTFLDFTAKEVRSGPYGVIPVHVFGPVDLRKDRLEISLLDPKWLHEAVAHRQILLAHKIVEDGVLLTAPTRELLRVMQELQEQHPEAFQKPLVFVRPTARPVS
jgi:hypothetical protein